MRRVGLVLAGLGTCLIVFALLMVTWVSSTVIKFPLNQYASVTLTDSNASYFSPSKLIPLTGVTMEATYTIKGNAAAGSDSTAVWNQFLYVYDQTNKLPFQTMTRTFAFDRRTAELVNCCGAHVNGNSSVQQTGYVGILLPIGTEKKTYPVFDPNILKTVPFHYVGLDEVGGTEAYKFNGIVPPTQTGTQTVPGSLVNQSGASVTLPQYFESDTTYWIDPVTGALLNVTERQKVTLRNSSGAQALLLFDANLAATSTSIDSLVAIDNAQLSKASFVSTLLPLVSGIVGAILLVVGLLLWRRPRQEADVEAGRSPGASELAAAGPEGGAPAAHVSLVPGLDDQPREATATAEPKEASPMLRAEAARPQAEAEQTKGAEAADKPAAPQPAAPQPAAGATAAGAAAAKDDGAPAEAPTAEMTAGSADPADSGGAVPAEDTGDSVSADDASDSRRGRPGAHRR